MYDEETIDERNSMRSFRKYTSEEILDPITQQEMKQACKEREKLQNVHRNDCLIDIWETLV